MSTENSVATRSEENLEEFVEKNKGRSMKDVVSSLVESNEKVDAVMETYRIQDDPFSSDDDDDEGSDSEESIVIIEPVEPVEEIEDPKFKKFGPLVKGELTLDDLPPVEKLQITVPQDNLEHIGQIESFVDRLVVVESSDGHAVINIDTVLFLEDGRAIGRVFDVIGPVKHPYYILRFNNSQEICDEHLEKGVKVFMAPNHTDYTFFVFEKQLKEMMQMRGSDASWENDVEPPEHELDYSDDEQERLAKRERRSKRNHTGQPVDDCNNNIKEETESVKSERHETNGRPQRTRTYHNSQPRGHPPQRHPHPPHFRPGVPPPGYNPWAYPNIGMHPMPHPPPHVVYAAPPPGAQPAFYYAPPGQPIPTYIQPLPHYGPPMSGPHPRARFGHPPQWR